MFAPSYSIYFIHLALAENEWIVDNNYKLPQTQPMNSPNQSLCQMWYLY